MRNQIKIESTIYLILILIIALLINIFLIGVYSYPESVLQIYRENTITFYIELHFVDGWITNNYYNFMFFLVSLFIYKIIKDNNNGYNNHYLKYLDLLFMAF